MFYTNQKDKRNSIPMEPRICSSVVGLIKDWIASFTADYLDEPPRSVLD